MIFRQITHDDLGCASYLIGDEQRRRRGRRRPALRDRRVPRAGALHGRRASSTSSRRTTTPTTSRDTAGSPRRPARRSTSTATPTPTTTTSRSTTGTSSSSARSTVRVLHTPGHRPEHSAFALIDTAPQREAVGGPHGRHAVRQRRRAARPRGREVRGRPRHLPLAHREAAQPSDSEVEIWPGHLGGSMCGGPGMDMKISSTIGYEREPQPDPVDRRRGRVRGGGAGELGPQPPNFEAIVELNKGPLLTRRASSCRRSRRARSNRSARRVRCSSTCVPTSSSTMRTSPGRCATRCCGGLRVKARVARRPRPGGGVRRPRRRRRPTRRAARARRRRAQARRVPARRHDQLVAGEAPGRAHRAAVPVGAICPRASTANRDLQFLDVREQKEWDAGPHPRLGLHAVARHRRTARRARSRDADRGDVRRRGSAPRRPRASSSATAAKRVIHVVDGGVPKWGRMGHELESADGA